MEFLKLDSTLSFGKYKGRNVKDVFLENPSYLYWMLSSGFSAFGKEVTELLMAWEESFPKEAQRVKRNIENKKKQEQAGTAKKPDAMDKTIAEATVAVESQRLSTAIKDPLFGSW
jgi:hypothetical protein